MSYLFKTCLLSGLLGLGIVYCRADSVSSEIPDNFRSENLVAWCVAPPWDAKNRDSAERAELLAQLGLRRVAYNWPQREGLPDLEEEILEYKKNGLEFFAFWNEHEKAFALFKKHGLKPQIWKINPSPKKDSQEEKIRIAAGKMRPFAQRALKAGCKFGLYNHGRWGGQPMNLVAVCEELHRQGLDNVGIVYNFHHGHEHIEGFAEAFEQMKPYLLCLNLNGMSGPESVDPKDPQTKILPIGAGLHESAMIEAVLKSRYDGPVGIIGHIPQQDVARSLQDNLEGLDTLLDQK